MQHVQDDRGWRQPGSGRLSVHASDLPEVDW